MTKYLVTRSNSWASPSSHGVSKIIPCNTLDEARKAVEAEVEEMGNLIYPDGFVHTLVLGDMLTEDLEMTNDCEECNYAYSESGLTAWANALSERWEKVETWEWYEDEGEYHLVEGPVI